MTKQKEANKMELLSLEMINYRRFQSPTKIEFANGDKNVTIIRGVNGGGKTSILMALLFGLFGTTHYSQFRIANELSTIGKSQKAGEDCLVSLWLLADGKAGTATVKVEFREAGEVYSIERSITAKILGGHVIQNVDGASATLYKNGKNTNWTVDQINQFMNGLVGENIREFLFFDGERYTQLFEQNSKETTQQLIGMINNLLNVEDLDKTIDDLKIAIAALGGADISPSLESDIADAENAVKKIQDEIKTKKDRIDELSNEISDLKSKQEAQLETLKGLEKYKGIVEKIEDIEKDIGSLKAQLAIHIQNLSKISKAHLLGRVYASLGPGSLSSFEQISFDYQGGQDLIAQMLKSGKCLCCDHPLTPDQRSHLESHLKSLQEAETYSPSLVLRAKEVVTKIHLDSDDAAYQDAVKGMLGIDAEIRAKQIEKDGLIKQLPPEASYENLHGQISSVGGEAKSYEILIKGKKEEIEALADAISVLEGDLKKALDHLDEVHAEAALANNKKDQYDFYQSTVNSLMQIRLNYVSQMQKAISEASNDFFLKMLSPEDRNTFDRLTLDDDYSIKVFDKSNNEVFASLAAGQRLLAAVAFIMGLTYTASSVSKDSALPLFMDTPFARLDLANRRSVINNIPQTVTQWILTPTNTEVTIKEADAFKGTGKVGSIFVLGKHDNTTIVEQKSFKELEEEMLYE